MEIDGSERAPGTGGEAKMLNENKIILKLETVKDRYRKKSIKEGLRQE